MARLVSGCEAKTKNRCEARNRGEPSALSSPEKEVKTGKLVITTNPGAPRAVKRDWGFLFGESTPFDVECSQQREVSDAVAPHQIARLTTKL
jgi:hypothetical protein